jgi:hypothetical protein
VKVPIPSAVMALAARNLLISMYIINIHESNIKEEIIIIVTIISYERPTGEINCDTTLTVIE